MVRLTQSYCCARCFKHRGLMRFIRSQGTPNSNRSCDYCGATRVHVVEIGELTHAFQNFMDLFDRDESGWDTLIFHADEWGVFNDTRHNEATAAHLFNDVVNAAWDDDDGKPPVDAADYYRRRHTVSDEWYDFCEEVRLDPTTPFPLNEYIARRVRPTPSHGTRRFNTFSCSTRLRRSGGVSVPYRGAEIRTRPFGSVRMKRLLARLELIEATGVLEIDMGWVYVGPQGRLRARGVSLHSRTGPDARRHRPAARAHPNRDYLT